MISALPFDADVVACAGLLERGDPDRFRAAMAAPPAARPVLFPLYAFNLEVARAPWVTQEPMIAEMRLQWWRDAIEEIATGALIRRHEVVTPLARVVPGPHATDLDTLIAVRRWDIYRDAFEDTAHFDHYIDATSGSLFWAAGRALGAQVEQPLRDLGWAVGVANWLRAAAELEARGRIPLLDGTHKGIQALARRAQDRLKAARGGRANVPMAAALAGWQADRLLRRAIAEPGRVAAGRLHLGDAESRAVLLWHATTGRW